MKIVCEACQAKYSISDDKVRGKAFKIRCKKCGHIIVVRSAEGSSSAQLPVQSDAGASGSAASASSAEDNNWHIVVDGEQVGPLSTSDVRARLSRGEITGETFIWREGLPDWLKVSAVPAFSELSGLEEDPGTPFPAQPPTTVYPPGTAESAFAASPAAEQDVFAAPTTVSKPAAAADLFASPVAAAPEPAASPSFSFGASAAEPAARHTGNGATAGGALTGQRHENSVLFSLSNLEALAAPSAPASPMPRPGVSSASSEGSGLIDIRSMAAMTLGNQNEGRVSSDLPTFGAPQFSPVAPVLLPIGQPSGPPKWVFVLLGVGVLVAVAITAATITLLKRPTTVATAPTPPAPAQTATPPAPTPPAPAVAHPATPPTTPPAPANEVLPPRETKPATASTEKPAKGGHKGKGTKGKGTDIASAAPAAERPAPSSPTPRAEAPSPNVGKGDKLDDLLNAALGSKKASRASDDDAPVAKKAPSAPAAAALQPLEKSDIVRAMAPVNGKVRDCYNQYKVPGTAMVSIRLARGGKVADASVTGKFAGTPTGSCVESAAKTAKFPATDAQTIQYPFALH